MYTRWLPSLYRNGVKTVQRIISDLAQYDDGTRVSNSRWTVTVQIIGFTGDEVRGRSEEGEAGFLFLQ